MIQDLDLAIFAGEVNRHLVMIRCLPGLTMQMRDVEFCKTLM